MENSWIRRRAGKRRRVKTGILWVYWLCFVYKE